MPDQLEILMQRGAQCVGGDVVFRNKSMGRLRNGVFDISSDGLAELEITDVDAVEVKPAENKPRKPRAKKVQDDGAQGDDDLIPNLDDLPE